MKRIDFKDGTYAVMRDLTVLEREEVEYDLAQPPSFAIACDVAYALEDWNGEGKKDPLELYSKFQDHLKLYSLSKVLDEMTVIETLMVTDFDTSYLLSNDDVEIIAKPLTVLQFMDLIGQIQGKSKRGRTRQKCELVASIISTWHTGHTYTADELYADRSMHVWVVAIEAAFADFFRISEVDKISDFERILDDDQHNGRNDDIKSIAMEPIGYTPKGFSHALGRI